ncbi:MAG: thiosulfate oxidation carrier protein SoxY [Sulfurimonas sp.]|nr:MAG: thiosulfate oxidation carrier protein SoxY [Sulfurimonas sp.]
MQRRKFLSLGAAAAAVSVLPVGLSATDFRATAPKAWEAPSSREAIEALFGSSKMIEGQIQIKAPKLAENGGAVPISVKSKMAFTTIAIFQDANPRSAVAVVESEGGISDMTTKIKMRKSANVTVVAKGADGKLYSAVQKVEVSIGGCGG